MRTQVSGMTRGTHQLTEDIERVFMVQHASLSNVDLNKSRLITVIIYCLYDVILCRSLLSIIRKLLYRQFESSSSTLTLQVISGQSEAIQDGFVFAAFGDANLGFIQEKEITSLSISDYGNIFEESKRQVAAITILPNIVEEVQNNIALTIFQDDSLFIAARDDNSNVSDIVSVNLTINTNIIAASIGERNTTDKLKVPVNISLPHKQVHNF